MKHDRNGVGVSISRCTKFHENTRNFTGSYKPLKTNLILKNRFVSYLERGAHWFKHLAPIFVFLYSYPIIFSPKLKTILRLESFQTSKTKKRPLLLARSVYKILKLFESRWAEVSVLLICIPILPHIAIIYGALHIKVIYENWLFFKTRFYVLFCMSGLEAVLNLWKHQ